MIKYNSINIKTWAKLGQRGSFFGSAVFDVVEEFDNTIIATADLGYLTGLVRFIKKHPDKYLNVGIAEQNLLGICAGLAQEGKIVFATTYATFITMRSFEQLRHYLGYMKSNVKVVGTGAGLVMGLSGSTHYTYEDIAITRAIPNMVVISPADAMEAVKVAMAVAKYNGPVYIRLTGGLNIPMVYQEDYDFQIGRAVTLKDDGDISIFATGLMVSSSLEAAEILKNQGINVRVINIHTIKPIDIASIEKAKKISKLIVSVEEHNISGGLGGCIAEELSKHSSHPELLMLGIDEKFRHAGDYTYLLEQNELLPEQIAKNIAEKYTSIIYKKLLND